MQMETILSTSGESFSGNLLGSKGIIKSCVINGETWNSWVAFFPFLIRNWKRIKLICSDYYKGHC